MNTRARNLVAVVLLGLCAYVVGLLAGRHANRALHRSSTAAAIVELHPVAPAAGTVAQRADTTQGEIPADHSAFLPNSLTPMQFLEAKLQASPELGKGDFGLQRGEWGPVLFLLSTNDYPRAWSLLKDMRSRVTLLGLWAQKDPRAALAAVMTLPEGSDRQSLLSDVLLTWAATDPESCVAWVHQMPESERRDKTLRWVITGMGQQHTAAATKLLEELPPGAFRDNAVVGLVDECTDTHPEAAAALAETAKDVFQRQGLFRGIGNAWAARSLPDALAWAQNLSNPKDKVDALAGVVGEMVQTQPQEAVQVMLSQADPDSRGQLARSMAGGWAERDLQAAANWLSNLPDISLRQPAWEGIKDRWISQDPEAAASFAVSSLPAGKARTAALDEIGRQWTQSGWDERAAVQWASRLPPGAERDAFLSGLRHPSWRASR